MSFLTIRDTSHFRVRDIIVLDWVLESVDPSELPPGHHGPLPKMKVLEQVAQSDGTTPLSVTTDQFVLVRVQYADLHTPGTFAATLIIQGDTWAPIAVPLSFFSAQVTTDFLSTPLVIWQGQQASIPISMRHGFGPATDVSYKASVLQLHTGLTLLPNSFHLEPGQTVHGVLTFQAAPDAPLGENTVFVDQIAFGRQGLLLPVTITPVPETVLAQRALIKILEKYALIGGENSPLGLPTDPTMPLRQTGNTYKVEFRGGQVSVTDPMTQEAIGTQTLQMEVRWVGLECQVRQEKVDEIYGGIGAIAPGVLLMGRAANNALKFPDSGNGTIDMGPDGQRIFTVAEQIYSGPPTDLFIQCQLIEHDSGNVSAAKEAYRQAIDDAAKQLGSVGGVSAERLATDVHFIAGVFEFIINKLGDPLGASDDAYNPESFIIHWEDQIKGFPKQVLTRNDDPGKSVTYTHSQVVTGIDDGGDLGKYAFYFDVRTIPMNQPISPKG